MNAPAEYLIFKINVLKRLFLLIPGVSISALLFGQREFALGFFIGGALSMAIFSLLYKYVLETRNFSAQRRKKFIISRSLLIYAIMGIALLIGIKKGIPAFLGTAAGLLSLKIAVFIQAFREKHASA